MLFQLDITGMEWIVGAGVMFGLAIVMSLVTKKTTISFLAWLFIFNGFVVASELLPLWTLILTLIALTVSVYLEIKGGTIG